jgi:hypothetical protein
MSDDTMPHLQVYGPGDQEPDSCGNRHAMCEDIAKLLNDGVVPKWWGDMERTSETVIRGCDGSMIIATGPSYDTDPPNLNWAECNDNESRNRRIHLIDKLYLLIKH